MNLVLWVIFTYDIADHHIGTGEGTSFETIDELKLALKNGKNFFNLPYTMPYELNIVRSVQIVDMDKKPNKNDITQFFIGDKQKYKTIELGQESIKFIVTDKLMYPKDVRKTLTKKYGNTIDFNFKNQWNEKQPVYFSGVTEQTQYGLRDSRTGAPTQYTLRSVNCRALNDQDIVVDSNLNQIWPIKTGKTPNVLTELLAKTKEEIYQR